MHDCHEFVGAVVDIEMPHCFNPYRHRCDFFDVDGAPDRRLRLLSRIVAAAASAEVDALWIGRDLGYRGGRRTGLALTDDVNVHHHARRWGVTADGPFVRGAAQPERTASVVWALLSRVEQRVFLWNVFPFHPHEAGKPLSNRAHNARERRIGEELLSLLIRLLRPRTLVAIGKDATASAIKCRERQDIVTLRHPSYGGQKDFVNGIRSLYGLT
jgi:uracil-DNA glycosylase